MTTHDPAHNPATIAPPSARYTVFGLAAEAEALAPGLHIVATPIGNLRDISLRALATLAAADAVIAEDTRVSKTLLAHYGISTPLTAYHEHNAAEMRPRLIARLQKGARLALISDAGTPLVSDPGYKLARAAIEAGITVTGVPGPSAVLAGLVLAGLPSDRFFFEGFLPPKTAARRARLTELASVPGSLVFFESPRRVTETLADAAAVLGTRDAAVARELTKLHEEVRRGPLPDLATHYSQAGPPRGEIVLLIGPAGEAQEAASGDVIDDQLRALIGTMSLKEAVAQVTASTGQPRRKVYARALELTRQP
ncbi:MAG: 16S rRNA (cytidine(1402)-2'-O)-methyltransferase [Bosea sp. (in: a-proteobacteria)]